MFTIVIIIIIIIRIRIRITTALVVILLTVAYKRRQRCLVGEIINNCYFFLRKRRLHHFK